MGRAPARHQPDAQHAARRHAQQIVGRLAVDKVAGPGGQQVRRTRAVAAALLADHEQQPDLAAPGPPQPVGRHDLGGDAPFGVAGAATEDQIALLPAAEKGGHAVQMRGEHHVGRVERRQEVEPGLVHPLLEHLPAPPPEILAKPACQSRLAARGRIDVDEGPQQRHGIGRR